MRTQNYIKIHIKAFEKKWIKRASRRCAHIIFTLYQELNNYSQTSFSPFSNTISNIQIPKRYSYYTMIRSPHVDKRSGETFQKTIHSTILFFYFTHQEQFYLIQAFLNFLPQLDWLGVEIQVTLHHQSNSVFSTDLILST